MKILKFTSARKLELKIKRREQELDVRNCSAKVHEIFEISKYEKLRN
jgi:hypothetical protein